MSVTSQSVFIQENAFENVIWKLADISSGPQCVNPQSITAGLYCLQSTSVVTTNLSACFDLRSDFRAWQDPMTDIDHSVSKTV